MEKFTLGYQQSAERTIDIVSRAYRPALVSAKLLMAALHARDSEPVFSTVQQAQNFFMSRALIIPEGLNSIPGLWLAQVPTLLWDIREPHWSRLPYIIRAIDFRGGVLCFDFAEEQANSDGDISVWDRLRIEVNRKLCPNLWSPLSLDLERRIWETRPDLRAELFAVAD